MKIGFIGQGWIGRHYADNFESRGYDVTRYALETPFNGNLEALAKCDVVFIAVPTPTTKRGFDDSIVRRVIKFVKKGKIAVIKSTILPGTTESIQKENPDIFVMHSPEFLAESTAARDAAHPNRNVVGIPVENSAYKRRAQLVLDILPKAPYSKIMSSRDAEFVKYAGNCFLFTKVVYVNVLYDLIKASGGNWNNIREAFVNDPRIGPSHTEPVHQNGRGAGGHCFIKDFEAFRRLYKHNVGETHGNKFFDALHKKNVQLLSSSGKDGELLRGVHGTLALNKYPVKKEKK